jgi:hypothetical protein
MYTISYAAISGSLDMLRLVSDTADRLFGHPTGAELQVAMVVAAVRGHLHLCEYLREKGCAWSRDICTAVVSRRLLDALR